ncbi:MAG TPA: hypothetical protein VFU37_17115 [Pyrinomonadaceae bacterium]|nr:hypothetical protein [Pyrinomonadaceae bacterium]
MLRAIAAVIVAFVSWFVIATIGNLALRLTWHDYAQVERALNFTLAMMLARLVLGTLSSLGAGVVVARISRSSRGAALSVVGLLLLLFLPVHYQLWQKFPIWYHLVFLASLIVIPLLGAKLYVGRAVGESVPGDADGVLLR